MKHQGFTVIELLVTLAILGVLVMVAMPLAEVGVVRNKEAELRANLRQLRNALDAYKQAYDDGRITKVTGASGYPPNLEVLIDGVDDISQATPTRMYFLRRIPQDPITPLQSWGLRSYQSTAKEPQAGRDVFDVYSQAKGIGLNGVPYREW